MTCRVLSPNEYGSSYPRRTTCLSFELCPFLRVYVKRSLQQASSSPKPKTKQQQSFIVHKVRRATLTSTTSSSPIRLILEDLVTKSPASGPPSRAALGLATGNVVSHVEQQLSGQTSSKEQDNTVRPPVLPGSCTASHSSAPCCKVHAHWQPGEREGERELEWEYKSVYRLARHSVMTNPEEGRPSSVVGSSPDSKDVTNTAAAMSSPSGKEGQKEKMRMHMARLGPLAPEGYKDMARCDDIHDGRYEKDDGCQLDGAATSQLDWRVNKDGDKEEDSGEAGSFPIPRLLLTTNSSKTSLSTCPCSRSLLGQEVPSDLRGRSRQPFIKQFQNNAQVDDRRTLPSQRKPLSSNGHIVEPRQVERGYRQVLCQIVACRHGGDAGEREKKPWRLYPELRRKPGCRSLRESTSRMGQSN